jgi:hypothetical protein
MSKIGDSIVSLARETSYGSAGTPSARFLVTSEDLALDIERVESKALGNRYQTVWAPGKRSVEGSIELEVPDRGFGTWMRAFSGANPTTTANSPVTGLYTHVFSGENNIGDVNQSLTIEVQRTDVSATDHAFTYTGMQINEWTIGAEAGEIATSKFSFIGQDMTVAAASASAGSYTTSTPYVFTGATVTVGGTSRSVKAMEFTANLNLTDDRYFLGSDKRSAPVEAQQRECSGNLTVDWNGLTDWNRYIGTSTVGIVATFQSQAALAGSTKGSFEVSIPYARIDGAQPVSTDAGIIQHEVQFTALDAGANDPFKVTIVDTRSSYSA